jgi:hypothetical protein
MLLFGVMSISGREQELWARWADSTNDLLRAHNALILHVCANNPSRSCLCCVRV